VTVSDANQGSASASFSLMVNAGLQRQRGPAQPGADAEPRQQRLHAGHGLGRQRAAELQRGAGPAGRPEPGPASGAISGTPSAVTASTVYTVSVSDANQATASADFRLTVEAAVSATAALAWSS
jgi:hypothetical protein